MRKVGLEGMREGKKENKKNALLILMEICVITSTSTGLLKSRIKSIFFQITEIAEKINCYFNTYIYMKDSSILSKQILYICLKKMSLLYL